MTTVETTCSALARNQSEPLYGSIAPAARWLLLEYRAPFGEDALADARISVEVKAHLEALPNSKTLLIRQPGQREAARRLRLYAVQAAASQPAIFRIDFDHYEEILTLDLENLLASRIVAPEAEPLYAVCANGKRDQCCARFGVPFYEALVEQLGGRVWQCSHIGGHRFAATMLAFPHGDCYGYLDASDAPQMAAALQAGSLVLEKWRGRAVMPQPAQAAEYYLRQALSLPLRDALRFESAANEGPRWQSEWLVAGQRYRVHVHRGEREIVADCHGLVRKAFPDFTLEQIESLGE